MTRAFRSAIALSIALTLPAVGARGEDLPKGEKVLEDYVEATGGKAAYEKVKNRVAKGTLEITKANLKGDISITQAEPNKMLTVVELGPVGKTTQGTDGKLAWEISGLTGERLIEGEEKDVMIAQATFNSEIDPMKRYSKVECTGVEDVDGKPAYKLAITPKVGKPSTEFYDKASKLQVKSVATQKSPMGEITVESFPGDYKKVDGILMPFQVKQKVLTNEIVITIAEVKQNVDLPADTFKVPAEIAKLKKD